MSLTAARPLARSDIRGAIVSAMDTPRGLKDHV
jgi:hypothetical protein